MHGFKIRDFHLGWGAGIQKLKRRIDIRFTPITRGLCIRVLTVLESGPLNPKLTVLESGTEGPGLCSLQPWNTTSGRDGAM